MDKATIIFEVEGMLALLKMELESFAALMGAGLHRKAGHSQYYAAYDACCALLLTKGIKVERHEGAQSMISLHFVKSGLLPRMTAAKLNQLMGQRHAVDYHAAVDIGYDEVAESHAWLIDFIGQTLRLIGETGLAGRKSLDAVRHALQQASKIPPKGAASLHEPLPKRTSASPKRR